MSTEHTLKDSIEEQKDTNYAISSEEKLLINRLKAILVFLVIIIHSNKNEIHLTTGNIVLTIPEWLRIIKYIGSKILSRPAVPLYFIISSVLLYRREFNFIENLKKKANSLLLPYFILNTLWIVFFVVAQKISFLSPYFANDEFYVATWGIKEWINAYLGFTGYPVAYHLWFLRDLFVMNVLAKPLMYIVDKKPRLSLIAIIIYWISGKQSPIFCISREALVFWIVGAYIITKRIKISSITSFISKCKSPLFRNFCLILLAGGYMGLCITDCYTRNIRYGYIVHNTTILVGVILYPNILNNLPCKRKIHHVMSKYCLGIYLFHEYFLKVCIKVLGALLPNTPFWGVCESFSVNKIS